MYCIRLCVFKGKIVKNFVFGEKMSPRSISKCSIIFLFELNVSLITNILSHAFTCFNWFIKLDAKKVLPLCFFATRRITEFKEMCSVGVDTLKASFPKSLNFKFGMDLVFIILGGEKIKGSSLNIASFPIRR